jgi:hypothetical protein
MTLAKRRYTTVDGKDDWIVSAAYDEPGLDRAHWFEAKIAAENERTGAKYKFPPEIKTYRIGEIEHSFRQYVALDFGGDREAAVSHHLDTIFRRVYAYIERGH